MGWWYGGAEEAGWTQGDGGAHVLVLLAQDQDLEQRARCNLFFIVILQIGQSFLALGCVILLTRLLQGQRQVHLCVPLI